MEASLPPHGRSDRRLIGGLEPHGRKPHAPGMTKPAPCLETERLFLRPVGAADAAETAELMTLEVARSLSTWPFPMSLAQARAKIEAAEAQRDAGRAVNFAIRAKQDERLAGWIGLATVAPGRARLGYWLGTPFQHLGYMREAAPAALAAASRYLRAKLVEAAVQKDNAASIAILENLGMTLVAEQEERLAWQRKRVICALYEWRCPTV